MEIKELKELVASLEVVVCTGASIMADGKVDSSDLGAVVDLLSKFGIIVEGIKGIKDTIAEAKDLDQAELIELGGILYGLIKKVKESYEAGRA